MSDFVALLLVRLDGAHRVSTEMFGRFRLDPSALIQRPGA